MSELVSAAPQGTIIQSPPYSLPNSSSTESVLDPCGSSPKTKVKNSAGFVDGLFMKASNQIRQEADRTGGTRHAGEMTQAAAREAPQPSSYSNVRRYGRARGGIASLWQR